jgi:cytochrome c-type biogenesis protein
MSDSASGVGIFAAVLAGLVSFLSPCVLPLVPGYLSAVVGVSPGELERAGARRVLGPSLIFVASFSTIFIFEGLASTALGSSINEHREILDHVAAALIVALGLVFVLSPLIPRLNREWHLDGLMARAGKGGPLLAGGAFAIAWTPCVGPTLASILLVASGTHSELHGAVLLAFYSAGLAIPFLATALAFGRMTVVFTAVKRHFPVVIFIGGTVLIAMGVLIWTNEFTVLNAHAQTALQSVGINFAI